MTIKKTTATIAAGAALLLVAGCGSGGDSAPAPGSAAAPASSADPGRASSLVLDKSGFPAGYQVLEVPRGQLKQISDSMLGTVRSAKVTPAECGQVALFPDRLDLAQVGFAVAMKATSMLAETVLVSDQTVDDVRKSISGACTKVTVEITEGQAAGGKGTTTSKVIDVPETKADKAIAVEQRSTIVLNGTTVKTTRVLGFAQVNGYLVGVQAGDAGAGGGPDLAAFNTTFAKAVDKVAAKTA
ncbi:hypothetical protein [Gordonia aichiensis]|uniref:hypothetical protein n=1 Tax=Gordonia aichiensis TaxID=36820 RepID=UPI003263FB4B